MSLIKICGNCNTYKFNSDPSKKGGCKNKGDTHSPINDACDDYQPIK